MIRALIVDDEKRAIDNLSNFIQRHCKNIIVSGSSQNIVDAEELIRAEEPDVIFLDIEMPGGNGFDLLDRIKDLNINIIFVTAFDAYAIDAFKANAINYLLKPIDPELLVAAVSQLEEYLDTKGTNLQEVLSTLDRVKQVERIKVPTMNGFDLIPIKDILYFESSGSYTQLVLNSGSRVLLSKNIGYFENELQEGLFFRIHREYIVNISEVQKYQKGRGGVVLLSNGTAIPVAVRRKKKLINFLEEK